MHQSALEYYADLAKNKELYPRLFNKEEDMHCDRYQKNKDIESLERLLINNSQRIIKKTEDLRNVYGDFLKLSDIDALIVEGMILAIKTYSPELPAASTSSSFSLSPDKKNQRSLHTHMVNYARQHTCDQAEEYILGIEDPEQGQKQPLRPKILGSSLQKAFEVQNILASDLLSGKFGQPIDHNKNKAPQHPSNDVMDALPDHRPESIAYSNELEESIREAFASLTPREAIVLKLRFGLYLDDVIKVLPSGESEALVERMKSDNPARKTYMTLEEIGDIIKVGKERVRGIEGKALRKMRSFSHSDSLLLLYRQESGVRSMLPQSEVEDIPALNSI